jgi:hypothetical protein
LQWGWFLGWLCRLLGWLFRNLLCWLCFSLSRLSLWLWLFGLWLLGWLFLLWICRTELGCNGRCDGGRATLHILTELFKLRESDLGIDTKFFSYVVYAWKRH